MRLITIVLAFVLLCCDVVIFVMLQGNFVAFQKLLKVHSPDAKLFLAPPSDKGKKVQMAKLLARYCETYLPDHQQLGATLARKFMHSDDKGESAYDKFFK